MSKLKSTSQIFKSLKTITDPIFYITNDVTKGLGLEKLLPNYHIICIDNHPTVDLLVKAGVNVFCLERALGKKNIVFRSSGKLLEHPLVEKYIQKKAGRQTPWILFFKPSAKIDNICKKRGYKKIGNKTRLNRLFEDKISFYQLCQEWRLPIPPGEIMNLEKVNFDNLKKRYGTKLIVQFGRGWAGSTTYFIASKKELNELKQKTGNRKVKINKFVEGKTILNNCCVIRNKVLVGPPAEQITAIPGFTAKKGGTCGRVWPARIKKERNYEIEKLSERIGEKMRKEGYLGYFGLDFLIDKKTGKIYISENNARLTASVPFYSKLEIRAGRMPLLGHHILVFIGKSYKATKLQSYKVEGSEIIVRNDRKGPVLVKKDFQPGIYKIKNDELSFVRQAYDVEGVRNKEEFFLTMAGRGRLVNPEMELARMNTLENMLNSEGRLKDWVISILLEVKENLWLS